jgi:hypothetical protein
MRRTLLMLPFSAEGSERLAPSPCMKKVSSSTHSTSTRNLMRENRIVSQQSPLAGHLDRVETYTLRSFSPDPPRSPTRASCTCPGTASHTSSVWPVLGPLMSRKPAKHSQNRTRTTEAAAQGRPGRLQDAKHKGVSLTRRLGRRLGRGKTHRRRRKSCGILPARSCEAGWSRTGRGGD